MTQTNQKPLGYFFAATAVFVWGITFVSTKYLLKDFSALEIMLLRFIAAYIGLWIIQPKFIKIEKTDNILFVLAALTGLILYQLSENVAINFTNASNVSVIVSICPLFTAIITQIFLKEKNLSVRFIIGFLISITGVALVCFNGTTLEFNPRGDMLALFAGICWGFYSMIISILNKKNYDPICATRRIFFFGIIFMLMLLPFILNKSADPARFTKPLNIVNIIFLGFVASGLCFVFWGKACKIVGTVQISCALYLIPVVTAVFAFMLLGEKMTLLGAAGAVITIAGLFISRRAV